MPRKEQTIAITGSNRETILAACYYSFNKLGWPVKYAGEDILLGKTPKSWNTNSLDIVARATDQELTVSSEMVQGESFDMLGKNKKNINTFLETFETEKKNLTPAAVEEATAALKKLQETTQDTVQQEIKDAAEINAALNLPGSNVNVTYAIIGINILIFIIMVIQGAGIFEPNGLVHIKWGSNFGTLTLSGDWWRLFTCMFLHFGIIHLLLNMYSLYIVGVYLEPLLGKVKYITAYLCTGIFASIISLWWHNEPANSAGASGAIFGMYGLFLALLTTKVIPKQIRGSLLQSIGIFVVYNLVYGMKGGIDNAAHAGGLISGFIIGYFYAAVIKKERGGGKVVWAAPVTVAVTILAAVGYLQQNTSSAADRRSVLNEVQEAKFKDSEKYNSKLREFTELENNALSVFNDSARMDEAFRNNLEKISLPNWQKAEAIIREMQQLKVSEAMQEKTGNVLQYVLLRKEEIGILSELIDNPSQENNNARLTTVREKMEKIIALLQ
jgi:rhomboid protease GluP